MLIEVVEFLNGKRKMRMINSAAIVTVDPISTDEFDGSVLVMMAGPNIHVCHEPYALMKKVEAKKIAEAIMIAKAVAEGAN